MKNALWVRIPYIIDISAISYNIDIFCYVQWKSFNFKYKAKQVAVGELT